MTEPSAPRGYSFSASPSAFINHIGRVFDRRERGADGVDYVWAALRVEQHHVNSWNFAHAAVIGAMADIGCAGPAYEAGGPPVVVVELSTQFIAAPKLGDLIEVKGWATKRTRSLVFTQCRGEIGEKLVFTATSIQKIIGA